MRATCKIDPLLTVRKPKDLVIPPVIIRVNKFNEDAVKKFTESMEEAHGTGQPVIPIVIDSYGGQVYSLLAMMDCIKSASLPVATIVEGKAMSCGAILLTCGQDGMRFAGPNSTVLIHDVSSMEWGKVEEIKAGAAETERLNQLVYRRMARNCGKDEEHFLTETHNRGHADWWLTPEEAKSHGMIQHIRIPSLDLEIKAKYNFK